MTTTIKAIFRFKNERPTNTQDASLCASLVGVVQEAVGVILKSEGAAAHPHVSLGVGSTMQLASELRGRLHLDPLLQDRKTPLGAFSATDREFLRHGIAQLSALQMGRTPRRGDVWTERWFPQYAAALQMECVSIGTLSVRLIALDGWERRLHFLQSGECVPSAVLSKHVVIYCGQVDARQRNEFLAELDKELADATKRTGSSRSANNKETAGHQKTPPFLASLMRNALDKVKAETTIGQKEKHLPRGGMTDVGKHTGGEARDTCWAIVGAVFQKSLPSHCDLFKRFEISLYCRLLAQELTAVRATVVASGTVVPNPVVVWNPLDRCVEMLDAIVVRILELGENGFATSEMDEKCRQWQLQLDAEADAWNQHRARCYPLPSRDSMGSMQRPEQTSFALASPESLDFSSVGTSTGRIRDDVLRQVSHYEFLDPHNFSTDAILKILETTTQAKSASNTINTGCDRKLHIPLHNAFVRQSRQWLSDLLRPLVALQVVQKQHGDGHSLAHLRRNGPCQIAKQVPIACVYLLLLGASRVLRKIPSHERIQDRFGLATTRCMRVGNSIEPSGVASCGALHS